MSIFTNVKFRPFLGHNKRNLKKGKQQHKPTFIVYYIRILAVVDDVIVKFTQRLTFEVQNRIAKKPARIGTMCGAKTIFYGPL